ncbi:MAG: hypothetical protein Ct9H90mP19_4920 [Gammaproteobacteria bacterium]|nr:MAG: hypothetical protein Ct9H90mP19_4920 [Gammaproteobacteria bacterium]
MSLIQAKEEPTLKKTEIDYNSTKELNKKGLASQSALVTTETVYETARIELGRTKIVAPFDGFVEKLAKEGQLKQNGQMCASIVSLSPLKIAGNVSELVVSKIKKKGKELKLNLFLEKSLNLLLHSLAQLLIYKQEHLK